MYLDTDVVLALIKEEDWLKDEVDRNALDDPKTSVITAVEIQIVYDDRSREFLESVPDKIRAEAVRLVPVDVETVDESARLLGEHERLNTFDSIHLAHSLELEEPIISTDTLYPELDEINSQDPRLL